MHETTTKTSERLNRSELGRRRPTAGIAIALCLLLIAAGCVDRDEPGVRVASKETSIDFGLKIAAAPPPGLSPPAAVPAPASLPEQPKLNVDIPPAAPVPPVLSPPSRNPAFCRTAGRSDFADQAPTGVSAPPKAGTYLYKPTPPFLFESDKFAIGPTDIVQRVVSDVKLISQQPNHVDSAPAPVGGGVPLTTTVWEYDLTTHQKDGTYVQDRYRVVDNGIRLEAGPVANVGPTLYTGQPDRGVSLLRRVVVSKDGGGQSAFLPDTPLLLLPLPAVGGQAFQSVSFVGGTSYALYGVIDDRQTTDACGDLVDGWKVDARVVYTANGVTEAATWTYHIATGLGGMPVFESVGPFTAPPNPVNGTALDVVLADAFANLPLNIPAGSAGVLSLARKEPV